MNYAEIKTCDIANGPGVRVSLFVSGCTHHCPGCFNEVAWDFEYGKPYTAQTEEMILRELVYPYVRGITLLGGEPFEPENQPQLLQLVRRIRAEMPKKTIWAYSGYLFDRDILSGRLGEWETTKALVECLDVLVDGPFIQERRNLSLRFRGSDNQRIIDVPASLREGSVQLWKDWQGGN